MSWKKYRLDEVAKVIGGGTPSTKNEAYFGGDIAWLTPKDLSNYKKKYISKGERNITQEGLKNSSAKLLPKGTVLLTTRASIGYVAIASNPISTNQGFKNLIPNLNYVSSDYLYYLLKSKKTYLEAIATGTTFKELSISKIKSLVFSFPPIIEQERIVKILSLIDEKIELLQSTNKDLDKTIQLIFNQWFINFEFPLKENTYLSNGGKLKSTKWGKFPIEWTMLPLKNLVSMTGGSTPNTKKQEYWNGNINWTTPKDLSKKESIVFLKSSKQITPLGLTKTGSGLLPKGTILLSSRAPIGYLAITETETAINQGFIAILCNRGLPKLYTFCWLRAYMEHIKNRANGTTFKELNKTTFSAMFMAVPPKPLLIQFEQNVSFFYKKIVENELALANLQNTKQLLLERLLDNNTFSFEEVDDLIATSNF